MPTTSHYHSNLRDIHFNLFELLRIQDTTLGRGRFAGLDREVIADALGTLERLCVNELAASFVAADRTPLVREADGSVRLPAELHRGLKSYWDGQWHLFGLPAEMGGLGAPSSATWAGFELLAGANPTAALYLFGSTAAWMIHALGTERQRDLFVGRILEERWGASMALTEPDAGSDVGAGRAVARHVDGDVWEIEGTKRFITNGEFDAVENIVHLVLARPVGAAAGTKGLSLFIVPKIWVEADGSLGGPNGVFCAGIEHKMGIRGSATCELVFGEGRPTRGLLMGERHDGIRQMFHLIEHARMGVGVKSMATLSTAYLNALGYARERIQGPDLLRLADRDAPRVPIIRHPDVRRMLMLQKAHAEGMRALCLFAASLKDEAELANDDDGAKLAARLNDLLLPLVKGFCSEEVYRLLALSLQCFGGSGYCQDYPIEQYIRDQKIDSLYEGTTHIQALDLIFRKVARDGGQTLRALLGRIRETASVTDSDEALAALRAALARALGHMEAMLGDMLGKMQASFYHVGLQANRLLTCLARLVIGWLLVRQAEVAVAALPAAPDAEQAFYRGKIAAASFYAGEVLPRLGLARDQIAAGTLELMELDEEAF